MCQKLYLNVFVCLQQPGDDCSFRTGKKFFLALDVSGSMNYSGCEGCPFLTPAVASFAMAMVTMNIEDSCGIYAFGSQLQSINDRINKNMTIQQAINVGAQVWKVLIFLEFAYPAKINKTNLKVWNIIKII